MSGSDVISFRLLAPRAGNWSCGHGNLNLRADTVTGTDMPSSSLAILAAEGTTLIIVIACIMAGSKRKDCRSGCELFFTSLSPSFPHPASRRPPLPSPSSCCCSFHFDCFVLFVFSVYLFVAVVVSFSFFL